MVNSKDINIVFFSDTHLGFDHPLRPRVKKRRRGEYFFKNFETVLSYAKNKNVDMVVHGGDLFFRSKVPNPIVDRVYQSLSTFADNGIPFYIVPGNHERSCLPVSLFLYHPYIHVFKTPKIFTAEINNARILIGGFPFIRENVRGKFLSLLNQSGWTHTYADIKILLFHQAVEGATVGPQNFTFRNRQDVIRLNDLPTDADIVLCGHIHRQQKLMKNARGDNPPIPVIFSGSTERTSLAEKEEEKGFIHLHFINDNKQKWILKETKFITLHTHPIEDSSRNFDLDDRSSSYSHKFISTTED